MATQHSLDHGNNIYLTVTVSPSSAAASNSQALIVHPSITHLGHVGQLQDVQLLSVPRASWDLVQDSVMSTLRGISGVQRVAIEQPPRMRAKRNADDL